MRGSMLGLLVAGALVAGLGGCALPEVLPLAEGSTSGPSPYGPWYEQHWATNSVLLAAADNPDEEITPSDDTLIDPNLDLDQAAADAEAAYNGEPLPVEANGAAQYEDFSTSSPYQFPSSEFAPPADGAAPAQPEPAPLPDGPLRY
ncbi:MAG: hypothetical protein ABR538_05095 [Candidatus Binatia bacterium]